MEGWLGFFVSVVVGGFWGGFFFTQIHRGDKSCSRPMLWGRIYCSGVLDNGESVLMFFQEVQVFSFFSGTRSEYSFFAPVRRSFFSREFEQKFPHHDQQQKN